MNSLVSARSGEGVAGQPRSDREHVAGEQLDLQETEREPVSDRERAASKAPRTGTHGGA